MRRDDVRDALDAMASAVRVPDADAPAAIKRGRDHARRRRLALVGIAAVLVAIVVVPGAIASDDGDDAGTGRISSIPTTLGRITVTPDVYSGPVAIPIAFASSTEGWLCGPTMQHTTDAGATWKYVTAPFGGPALPRVQQPVCAAIEGGEAWLLSAAEIGDGLQVIHVSAGGRHVETTPFPSLRSDWTVRELSFADREHGWAFARSAAGGAAASYVTSDGGRTWAVDTPVRHAPLWDTPTDGWTTLDFSPSEVLAHTADRGRTWDRVDMSGYADALQLIAADGDTVVVLGSTTEGAQRVPSFAVTTSGGDDWELRDAPRDVVAGVTMPAVASALDADRWWLGAANQLFSTRDGGRTWEQIAEFAGISQITDVHFLTPEIGLVSATGSGEVAGSSVVLRTDDGGEIWTMVTYHAPPMGPDGPINFPGGIFGCPTHPLAAPPAGNPPAGLIDASVQNIETERGWRPVGKQIAYAVGTPHGTYSEIFNFQIPSCGPDAVAASWVVELQGAPGSGGGGSTPQAQIVLSYSPDGWHVYGRYH